MKSLEEFGYCVIPDVLSKEECEELVSGIWDYFEHITKGWETPIKREDKTSHLELFKLAPKHGMLHQHNQVGHCQASWDVRQNPKVVKIFSDIWKIPSEDLIVSFDGLSFAPPSEETKRGWYRKDGEWFHVDQSYTRPERECIQGWVTGLDVNPGDATLGVYKGSHLYFEECGKRFGITSKDDWYKLNSDEIDFYLREKGCEPIRVTCPAGSLVLWDSRTVHCGLGPIRGRETPNTRAVIYVCYQPRAFANEKALAKKRKAFEEKRTTSHWPAKVKLFPLKPRFGVIPKITPIEKPVLTDLGKRISTIL